MATPKKTPKTITSQDLTLPPEEPSLLFAQRELILTNGIDFDAWWDDFKVGFVNGKRDKATNFKTKDWVKPKMVDITPTTSTSMAKTIEYWPDKDKPETSYLLSGTVSDLITGIMSIMREKEGGEGSVSGKGSKPLLRGYPCIKLLFMSDDGVKGIKQIRCVGFTENPKIATANKKIELLTKNDVGKWSSRIKAIFGDKEYVWRKGTECLSYSGMIARLQGIEGYAYVKSESDGVDLFKAMLEIFGQKPDIDGFNFSGKTNSSQFKKDESEKVVILGETLQKPNRRPIADCKFVSANLILDGVKKPIPMVRGKYAFNLNDIVLNNS
jgi:hypothetical protein